MRRAGFNMPSEYPLPDLYLHAHIRRCIDNGRLPLTLPDSINAGYGSGSKCHACEQPIAPSEIEYDVQDPTNGTARLRLHLGCYVLWQTECLRRNRTQRQDDLCAHAGPADGLSKKNPGATGRGRARVTRHS